MTSLHVTNIPLDNKLQDTRCQLRCTSTVPVLLHHLRILMICRPLKIRVGIRDQWESPRAPIRHSIDALERILGHAITPQVDWPKVYSSLKDTFSEPSTFVPAIYRITIAFYGRLLSALEKESNKEWKETFLEKMAKIMNWRLYIEVPVSAVYILAVWHNR